MPNKERDTQGFYMPMAIISIVAMVAIVGILVVFNNPAGSSNLQVRSFSPAPGYASENIAGRSYFVPLNASTCAYTICYIDVPDSNPFHRDVLFMADKGFMVGYGNGYFGLNDNINRGQVAVVLARVYNWSYQTVPAIATFADVPTSHPFYNQIEVMYQRGITAGCATNPRRYCPDDAVTKWQFSIFLTRAGNLSTNNVPTTPMFSDVYTGDFYFPFIQAVGARGIMQPCNQYSQFCPYQAVTRGEAARDFRALYNHYTVNSSNYY